MSSTFALDAVKASTSGQVDDSTPLNDAERKMVARLLSDPFSFPQVFKTWLVAFLEGSDLTLPLTSVQGLESQFGEGSGRIFQLLPAGMVFDWAAPSAPTGTLFCDGRSLERVGTYKRLYDAIGTTWGAVDSSHFNIPDLRSRVVVGAGTTNPVGHMDTVAEASRPLALAHRHNVFDTGIGISGALGAEAAHTHAHNYPDWETISYASGGINKNLYSQGVSAVNRTTGGGSSHSHTTTGLSGSINANTTGTGPVVGSGGGQMCHGVCLKIINF